jgi:hypothetical protein
MLEHSAASGGFKRRLSGGYGFFDLGYLMLRRDHVRVFVLGGMGGGGIGLKAEESGCEPDTCSRPTRASGA